MGSSLRVGVALLLWLAARPARAHDLERTAVTLALDRDGSYVIEVANDPAWLLNRLEPFAARTIPPNVSEAERDRRLRELTSIFVDRVVVFVDGHEIRPASIEYVAQSFGPREGSGGQARPAAELGIYRLRGHLPPGARSLRWFYGIVIDPYPLTIRIGARAAQTQVVAGEAWSAPIDVSTIDTRMPRGGAIALVGVVCLLLSIRVWARGRRAEALRHG